MPTSTKNNAASESGFTLVELLVTLAIISFASFVAASAINAHSSHLVIDRAAEALVHDLKLIRLRAELRGRSITLVGTADSYQAEAADVGKHFPKGVTARWNSEEAAELSFPLGPGQQEVNIRLSKGDARAVVVIAATTGRISRVR